MYIYLSALFFALMGVTVKALAARIPSDEVAFFRSVLPAVVLLPLIWRDMVSRGPAFRRSLPLLLLRGFLGSGALLLYFRSISLIEFSNAALLCYTSPIFTAIFASLFLGEHLTRRAVLACAVAFAGVIMVQRPAMLFGGHLPAQAVEGIVCGLLAGMMAGGAYTSVRRLTEGASTVTIVGVFSWVATFCSLPSTVRSYVAPTALEWAGLGAMALLASLGQLYMTMGYRDIPAARASTMNLSIVVFATVLGMIFFHEHPDLSQYVGLAITLAGISMVVATPRVPLPVPDLAPVTAKSP